MEIKSLLLMQFKIHLIDKEIFLPIVFLKKDTWNLMRMFLVQYQTIIFHVKYFILMLSLLEKWMLMESQKELEEQLMKMGMFMKDSYHQIRMEN